MNGSSFWTSPIYRIRGNIFPVYEAHYESEIKDSLETARTPFENSELISLGTDSRVTQRKKRALVSVKIHLSVTLKLRKGYC